MQYPPPQELESLRGLPYLKILTEIFYQEELLPQVFLHDTAKAFFRFKNTSLVNDIVNFTCLFGLMWSDLFRH